MVLLFTLPGKIVCPSTSMLLISVSCLSVNYVTADGDVSFCGGRDDEAEVRGIFVAGKSICPMIQQHEQQHKICYNMSIRWRRSCWTGMLNNSS